MENNDITVETVKAEAKAYRSKASLPHLWWGLVLAGIFAAVCIAIGISGDSDTILGAIILCIIGCPFFASLPLEDSTPRDVMFWMGTKSISFPGLIWEFSFDGFIWLIGMKILFAVIGFLFGVICAIIGVVVAAIISPFTYGFNVYSYVKERRAG
jgi:hypothetical protein